MLGRLRTGSTRSAGVLPEAGTDGQDSSEVAADVEVKGGVVTFYEGTRQTSGHTDMAQRSGEN
jgi:hypothetical protein